ncbi:MAG: hypothetical protein QM731_26085 [Chitinophagaceae bacterium]
MKSFFVLILLFVFTNSFAQTKTIYARFTKGDGARIKGTSTMRGYEDQLIVVNYTGGADNTAIIEIEVPTSACIADFRNMMNTAPKATQPAIAASKPVATSAIKPANAATAGLPEKTITVPSLATFPISRIDISVTNRVNNSVPTLTNQVILEDAKVESCTDIPASSTTRIKLKANRIGWIYFNTDPKTGKPTTTNKSGWDVIAGGSWTNF